jgi:DNA mismatch repair ATPase MutL
MLRCYVVTLPPVGGIPIVQHLETNLHPLRVQMTYNFGKALAYYLFPPEKRQKQQQQQQQPEQSSTLPSTFSAPAMAGSESSIQYEIPQLAASSITLPVTANDKDTVKTVSSSKSTESAPAVISNSDDHAAPTRDDSELSISAESMGTTSKQSKKQKKQQLQKETKSKASDDLMVMKKRASSNRTFILVKIPGTRHCLSYQVRCITNNWINKTNLCFLRDLKKRILRT